MKRMFFVCLALWLIGGVTMMAVNFNARTFSAAAHNLQQIFIDGFGCLTVVLGLILLVRWIWSKMRLARWHATH
jgi:hypothetical protein